MSSADTGGSASHAVASTASRWLAAGRNSTALAGGSGAAAPPASRHSPAAVSGDTAPPARRAAAPRARSPVSAGARLSHAYRRRVRPTARVAPSPPAAPTSCTRWGSSCAMRRAASLSARLSRSANSPGTPSQFQPPCGPGPAAGALADALWCIQRLHHGRPGRAGPREGSGPGAGALAAGSSHSRACIMRHVSSGSSATLTCPA
jgi:hypothetical protein